MNNVERYKNFEKDINLGNLFSALIECFSIILCGFIAGRMYLISSRESKGLDIFVRTFSLPCIIFVSLAQLDISVVNWKFLGSILVAKSIVFSGVIIVSLFLNRPLHLGKIGLYAIFCTQSNDFAIGYPILKALYGTKINYASYVYLLAPISLGILNPIAYVLIEIGKINSQKFTLENRINNESAKENNAQDVDLNIASNSKVRKRSINENDAVTNKSSQTSNDNDNVGGFNKQKFNFNFCATISRKIVTNPIILTTALGLTGNLFYKYIKFIEPVLNAFASVFSTSALFLLGLRMVGSVHKFKGNYMITPGILIITKLLVLPLITREVVSLLHPGSNSNDTLNLSSFGFMYGTFPTAPLVFVLASQYDIDVDVISSSLVACTFLSAPLMYISAKMIFFNFMPNENFYQKLESFAFNISVIGIPAAIWLIVLFIGNKSFKKIPQKITGFLIISQLMICIGMVLLPVKDLYRPWSSHLQYFIFMFGIYSSRLWTTFLAITLVLLKSRSLCFMIKLMPRFIIWSLGIPAVAVVAECVISSNIKIDFASLINPDFRFGKFQSIITVFILFLSFVGTSVCLILQQYYQQRFSKYLVLVQEVNSRDLQEVKETSVHENLNEGIPSFSENCTHVTDVEEIISEIKLNTCDRCTKIERQICEQSIEHYNDRTTSDEADEEYQDTQNSRHIVLLLFLVTSMFVNLMLSVWTLVVEDAISGIYVELLFLNVFLNIGQIFAPLVIFGFDPKYLISNITNRWRIFYHGADNIILTPVEDLSFETTHVCNQFIAHHLRNCENDIAKNKRVRLRKYKSCFSGSALVLWLLKQRLAKDEQEATEYACYLLEGRVLRHVNNRYHFENSNLLYTFKN